MIQKNVGYQVILLLTKKHGGHWEHGRRLYKTTCQLNIFNIVYHSRNVNIYCIYFSIILRNIYIYIYVYRISILYWVTFRSPINIDFCSSDFETECQYRPIIIFYWGVLPVAHYLQILFKHNISSACYAEINSMINTMNHTIELFCISRNCSCNIAKNSLWYPHQSRVFQCVLISLEIPTP